MKDDLKKGVKPKGGEEAATAATPAEETKAPAEVEPAEPETKEPSEVEEEVSTTETEEGSSLQKKGASQRIRELNAKANAAAAEAAEAKLEAKSLADRLAEITGSLGPPAGIPPVPQQPQEVQPLIAPGEEIDAIELEKRMRARDERVLQQARAEMAFLDNVNKVTQKIDRQAREIVDTYPQLREGSTEYNKELTNIIFEASEAYVKSNPSGDLKGFVGKLMKPYQQALTKEVGEQIETLAKQASQQAVRPTSVAKGEKPFHELSIEEMEKKLGVVST